MLRAHMVVIILTPTTYTGIQSSQLVGLRNITWVWAFDWSVIKRCWTSYVSIIWPTQHPHRLSLEFLALSITHRAPVLMHTELPDPHKITSRYLSPSGNHSECVQSEEKDIIPGGQRCGGSDWSSSRLQNSQSSFRGKKWGKSVSKLSMQVWLRTIHLQIRNKICSYLICD